jgi:hypothetical protein
MMKWKVFGRKWSWSNFKVLSWHSPGWTDESHENLGQNSRSPGRDLNPGPPKQEAGVLTTRQRRSVRRRRRKANSESCNELRYIGVNRAERYSCLSKIRLIRGYRRFGGTHRRSLPRVTLQGITTQKTTIGISSAAGNFKPQISNR